MNATTPIPTPPTAGAVVEVLKRAKLPGQFKVLSVPSARDPLSQSQLLVTLDLGKPSDPMQACAALKRAAAAVLEVLP